MGQAACRLALVAALLGATACLEDGPRPRAILLEEFVGHAPGPLVLIGLDGVHWPLLEEMAAAGELPTLGALLERGARGEMHLIHARLPGMGWIEILTGRLPGSAGVSTFLIPLPGGELRLPRSGDRHVPSLWDVLEAAGARALVIGFDATWPHEPAGTFVSREVTGDLGIRALGASARGARTHPPELEAELAGLLRGGDELAPEELAELGDVAPELLADGPWTSGVPRPGQALRWAWAHQRNAQRVALHELSRGSYDAVAVQLDGASTAFMMPLGRTDADAQRLLGALRAIYRDADRFAGELAQRMEGATLVLASSYSTRIGDDGKPEVTEGAIAAAGPGLRPADLGPCAADVLPTLAVALGLPAARRLPGAVRAEALADPSAAPPPLESYDPFLRSCYSGRGER